MRTATALTPANCAGMRKRGRPDRHATCRGERWKRAEPADKPGSVVDSHSSRRIVADTLKQPTRTRRGPRHKVSIWSCSRWGLPCRSVTGLAVRSCRTLSPLPDPRIPFLVSAAIGGLLSVALSVGSRRPGVTWHRALWSPDFPRGTEAPRDCLADSARHILVATAPTVGKSGL